MFTLRVKGEYDCRLFAIMILIIMIHYYYIVSIYLEYTPQVAIEYFFLSLLLIKRDKTLFSSDCQGMVVFRAYPVCL